jgi:hypothetical protein
LGVDKFGRLEEWFKPDPDKVYFLHVDLAQKHDHCAVAMAHVDRWVNVKVTNEAEMSSDNFKIEKPNPSLPKSIQGKFGKTMTESVDKIKEETIQGMITGKYKYLVTAKALDEGLTIPNLELVIITFGSNNPIQQGQRSARGSTIDVLNDKKQTKIFNHSQEPTTASHLAKS